MLDINDILNPQESRVAKSTDNLIITIYGKNGVGKTPVATKMEKPFYLAFGKSGLSGINGVPFQPIKSWAEFRNFVKLFTSPDNYDILHEKYQTLILDEMEILYKYCENYVSRTNGVNKIKEGNGGYGLWSDLKDEWESEMMKIIGSGFCVIFILHAAPDETGMYFPVGDVKRMLPILMNHSEIIGYVNPNGVDMDTGKPIHSSLMLTGTDEYFARTRNDYFETSIEDFTAQNLVKAYYNALDRQAEAEGVTPVTKQEQDKMYETEEIDFDVLMSKVQSAGEQVVSKLGKEALTEVVESVLGQGGMVSKCTAKQIEAVKVILDELESLL